MLSVVAFRVNFRFLSDPSNDVLSNEVSESKSILLHNDGPYDIGKIMQAIKIEKTSLSDHEKYLISKNHFVPASNFEFPKSYLHGCNRQCKNEFLSDSFVYSKVDDAVYCLYCSLFVPNEKRSTLGAFVTGGGFNQWHKIQERKMRHSTNAYHRHACETSISLTNRFEKTNETLPAMTNTVLASKLDKYP